jgi:O-antigen/teichoic acid export membrane protein
MNQSWIRYLPAFLRAKVEGSASLQNIISSAGWLFADNVVRMGIGLLVSIWLIRYLGPEQFGLLSYALTFVLLFSPIAQLGLDAVVVRNIVRDPSRRNEILGSAFVLKLAGGLVTCLLCLIIILLLRPGDTTTLFLVGITALGALFQAFGVIDFWFQSQVQVRYAVYARIVACLAACALKVILILSGASLLAFAWAGLADIALGSMGLMLAYRTNGQHMKAWRTTKGMVRELLHDSWLFMLSDLVMLAYMRIDKIMIGEMVGVVQLGIYAVAALLAESLIFVPVIISLAIFPSVVEARANSEELFNRRLQQYYNWMALLGYGVALPVTFFAGWLVPLLFGPAYGAAAPMLVGLVWAGIFINLTTARSYYLTAVNLPRLHFVTDFLGCAANVSLNFFLIPRYGAMGAVAASIVSYCFAAYILCFVFEPLRRTGVMMTRALLYPKIW